MTTTTEKTLHAEAIAKLNAPAYEDGTYDVETLSPVSFETGFQVSFANIGDDYSEDDYLFITAMFSEASEDGKAYCGKFEGTAEISYHFADKLTAIRYARMFNQISIWDWKNCEEIATGGTGRR